MMLEEVRRRFCEMNKGLIRELSIPGKYIDKDLINHIIYDILFSDPNETPLQIMDNLLAQKKQGGQRTSPFSTIEYNSWPFGVQTNDIYNRAVGLCKKGIHPLGGVLAKMMEYSSQMSKKFGLKEIKTVIVITDYWDPKLFLKYEKTMLNYALKYGIWYIFLLVTDYGVTQIPFLPNNRNALRDYADEDIEEAVPYEVMLRRLKGQRIKYTMDGGTLNQFFRETYIFDEGHWENKDIANNLQMSGKVPKHDFQLFLEGVQWIYESDERDISAKTHVLDEGNHILEIFGRTVSWGNGALGEMGEPRFNKLQTTINRFISACEKNAKPNGR